MNDFFFILSVQIRPLTYFSNMRFEIFQNLSIPFPCDSESNSALSSAKVVLTQTGNQTAGHEDTD